MQLASVIFRGAAICGVIVLLLVMETRFGQDNPPPITHAEFYHGFAALALVWQVAFWIIGSDPARYRRVELRRACRLPARRGSRWGLVARGTGGTGLREAPSKKTSLRWALKEATARNQPWPGVDDRHYGARDDRAN